MSSNNGRYTMFKRYKNGMEEKDSTAVAEQEKVTPLGPQRRAYSFGEDSSHRPTFANTNHPTEPLPRIFESRSTGPVANRAATPMSSEHNSAPINEVEELLGQEKWERKPEQANSRLSMEEPETTLGEGVVFKGELSFKRLLRIDGHFEGELESDGKLVVGPKGTVTSPSIRLREAIIDGKVEGNLTILERVELRGDAEVHGNIEATSISVDEGVTIVGNVKVTPKASHVTEQNS